MKNELDGLVRTGNLEFLYEIWTGRWTDGENVKRLVEEDNWQLRFVF